MKQSSIKKGYEDTAALYLRLSRDDGEAGESNSIQNQKKLLKKSAQELGYSNTLIFSDDGVSGTTMNRPGFKAMIKEIEAGHIAAVIVKDAYVKHRLNFCHFHSPKSYIVSTPIQKSLDRIMCCMKDKMSLISSMAALVIIPPAMSQLRLK